jgi:hypothetical protein
MFTNEIVETGRLANADEIPSVVQKVMDLASKNGWAVKPGISVFRTPIVTYSDKAAKAGESRGGEEKTNVWIEGVHPKRGVRFTASWHDGKFDNAVTGWWLMKITQLKKFIVEDENA